MSTGDIEHSFSGEIAEHLIQVSSQISWLERIAFPFQGNAYAADME